MQEEFFLKKGFLFTTHLLTINYYLTITIAKIYWTHISKDVFFSVLISENENMIQRADCKDKFSTKKCKKLENKGKCKDKKTSEMCMETCKKCRPGIIEKIFAIAIPTEC